MMQFPHHTKNRRTALALALTGALLTACAGAPKQLESLDQANAAYSEANEDPVIAKHAALELDNARKSLDLANAVHRKGKRPKLADHYAYVTSKRVEVARQRASQLEADEQIELMKVERQKVQLEARAEEIEVAKRETLALQQQLRDMQAEHTERGLVMTLGDVLFDAGAANLAPGSAASISRISDFMRQYKNRTARIEGHTDSMGNEDTNYDLSVARANAVRTALIQNGIEPGRITTLGHGEARPVATNNTSDGRRQNRRVEIIFGGDSEQVAELAE